MPSSLSARALWLTLIFAAFSFAQMTAKEKAAQVASFELVWTTVRDHNPDPKLNGLDWDAIHKTFKPRVDKAGSASEVRGILREMIERLGVSHYSIIASDRYADSDLTVVAPVTPAINNPVAPSTASRAVEPAPVPAVPAAPTPAAPQVVAAPTQPEGATVEFGNLPKTRVEFETRTLEGGVGYIRFNEFLDPVSLMPRFDAAMKNFARAPGVILDLRGNRGGIGIMAMGIAGYFIGDSGHQLGEMKMRASTLKFMVFPRAEVYTGRLAVLLDEGSASTTEILAQGLKDLNRTRIFGTRSAGAALPSDIIRLPNGDGFQYPTASYTSASGRVLEGNGVIPDVEVSDAPNGPDRVIEAASAWIVRP